MNPNIFRAYDIRGKCPAEINEEIVGKIAQSFGRHFLKPKTHNLKPKIIIGRDARLSSPALYKAAIRGIMNNELRIKNKKSRPIIHNSKFIILRGDLMTTPMFYFLVNKLKADAGIMITASHNPKEYNGLKIVGKNAKPISGKEIYKIMNKNSKLQMPNHK